MEPVHVYIINNDICKSFLVILGKRLKILNRTYIFKYHKITDASRIRELKSKKMEFPILKVRGRTISGFENCAKFVSGQSKKPASAPVPANDDDIHDYLKKLCTQKDEGTDTIGDVMNENEVKKKMRDRMNHRAQDNMSRMAQDEEEDVTGDMFDRAMRETKMDNIDFSGDSDLSMQGIEADGENDLMLKHLMGNVQ